MCTVRHGVPADAARLSAFGYRVFHAAFAADNDPDDFEAYIAAAYTPAAQARELADPTITTLLAADAHDVLLAFAQVRASAVPDCVADSSAVELWRFYVDQAWHGRGVARVLMDVVHDEARRRGAGAIWLGVWEHNPRAQAFYRKCGFTPVGSHIFMVGSDPQTDQIWQLRLGR
jgi:GNAT superfamily N-acetyltransferase